MFSGEEKGYIIISERKKKKECGKRKWRKIRWFLWLGSNGIGDFRDGYVVDEENFVIIRRYV